MIGKSTSILLQFDSFSQHSLQLLSL